MILFFADRRLNIIGRASTELPKGLTIVNDNQLDDVETGFTVFECEIPFNENTQYKVDECTAVGNYILRSNEGKNEFLVIVEREKDTKAQTVYIYAEDAGLDLFNEICVAYAADKAYTIDHYINKFAYDSGFVIGINEVPNLTRKLSWDGESTATARLASVATQFDNCELSYSFAIENFRVTKKYINIHKKRGKDIGVELRLNRDVDRIVTKESITNLATALKVTGGTPEDGEVPINLNGYQYDDGDIFLEGTYLKSRKAVAIWSRYLAEKGNYTGHIMRTFTYDTTSQSELCNRAVAELKKVSQIEVNYEIDLSRLPENVRIGDRVNIVDDAGELYMSARVLKLERSVCNQSHKATLGEYLIKKGGISQKVTDLAIQFMKAAQSTANALAMAKNAKATADAAQGQANQALADASKAQTAADQAASAAQTATQSAATAQSAADKAQAAVDSVEKNVESLETTVSNAQQAAQNAQTAADTAQAKADEAASAAAQAKADAADAAAAVVVAQGKAETAITKADTAQETADTAKTTATTAKDTADAAKLDAQKANEDIASLGEQLETVSQTMTADYARKTDLTETEASLQSQISQNAAQISSTVASLKTVDETANNAAEQAAQAQSEAATAKEQADQATADAQAAQTAADNAAAAAQSAQSEADRAKAAAETAQSVADKAEADLEAAKADLATVSGRVDATEEEIAAAQTAVTAAQQAADKAKADAAAADKKAADAQTTADTAVTNAATAQTKANEAASQAAMAQQAADEAKGDAATAQAKANEAATAASNAQSTADQAVANASAAQTKANQAATAAANAQKAADDADARAEQAEKDLATAQQNLANVTSRVDATEEEVAAAQEAVETAQAAADKAKADAATAQATANTAKANAATAQTAADNAKKAADDAQAAADAAQKAADDAQAAVDALAVRVTKSETDIVQTDEKIELLATKDEVTQTLGGYYTKTETDAKFRVTSDEISSTVTQAISELEVGGRNLLPFDDIVYINTTRLEGMSTEYLKLSSAGQYDGIAIPHQRLEVNTEYVLHYDLTLLSGDGSVGGHSGMSKTALMHIDGEYAGSYANAVPLAQNTKVHVDVYIKTAETVPSNTPNIYIQAQRSTASAIVMEYVVENLKIEKGNKATDWSPAPEDMATGEEVSLLETRVSQTEEAIITQAAASDALGKRMTTMEQNAEGFNWQIHETAVVSSVEQFYLSTSATALSGGSWSNSQPTWTAGKFIWRRTLVTYGDGSTAYTPSTTGVCITGNTGATGAQGAKGDTGAAGADGQMLYATCGTAAATKAKVATLASGTLTLKAGATVAVKFTYANSVSSPTLNVAGTGAKTIRLNGAALTSSAYYWVAGAVVTFVYDGTYWNIADAAALTKSAEAAKTASNFMSYDATNGLLVGNKSSGSWSGYRTQMKSDSFNILDADGNPLASYGANEIDLGKNNEDTIVKFCNGKSQIRYDSSHDWTVFEGNATHIRGDVTTALIASSETQNSNGALTSAWAYGATGDNPYLWLRAAADYPEIDTVESEIWVNPDSVVVEGFDSIRLVAPAVAVEGGLGVDGDTSTTGEYFDKFGTRINNGLAVYGSSGTIDPNTTTDELILTKTNTPITGTFFYVKTFFYSSKTGNRTQLAIPYNISTFAMYGRMYNSSGWSEWKRILDEENALPNHNHPYVTTVGGFKFFTTWFGMYDSLTGAENESSRKGWMGYNNGTVLKIADEKSGVDITSASGNIRFAPAGTNRTAMLSDRFRPITNDQQYLGDSSYRWKAVYAVNGTIQTSDRNQKTNIAEIDQRYIDLFDRLLPVSFEFSDAESDRTHIGFISQDVKAAMDEVGLTDLDFAGFCRDVAIETVEEIDTDSPVLDDAGEPVLDENGAPTYHTKEVEKPVLDEAGNPVYIYSLRYTEFIALNSRMIQLNRERIAQQQTEIESLKADVEELKNLVRALTAQSGNEVVADG